MLQKRKNTRLIELKIDGFTEEKRRNKYLNIAFTENNYEVLKNRKKSLVRLRVVLQK